MGPMTEVFLILNLVASVSSIATPIALWFMHSTIKRGLYAHVDTMQLIYEEIRSANRAGNPPGPRS